MNRSLVCIVFVLVVWPIDTWADDPRGIATADDVAILETTHLECMIGNNKSHDGKYGRHAAGYNGIFWMRSPDQEESPFVPTYAGLNLEHFFDARPRPEQQVFFEPRYSPISLRRVSPSVVELHQAPTETYGVESWTRFEIREPYYIDFSFRCIPRQEVFSGGFVGVFWASYINGPADKSIYFLDSASSLKNPLWRQLCTQQHNRDSSVLGKSDAVRLNFQEPGTTLFSSISPLRYSEPFFYGRFRNMVLIYAFRPSDHLRFTHSPSGGGANNRGDDTNPAWDFQLIAPQVKVGQEYGLSGRLIYKPWQGRADVLAEVRKLQSE